MILTLLCLHVSSSFSGCPKAELERSRILDLSEPSVKEKLSPLSFHNSGSKWSTFCSVSLFDHSENGSVLNPGILPIVFLFAGYIDSRRVNTLFSLFWEVTFLTWLRWCWRTAPSLNGWYHLHLKIASNSISSVKQGGSFLPFMTKAFTSPSCSELLLLLLLSALPLWTSISRACCFPPVIEDLFFSMV